eukprot:240057-Amorphochlora_amoeboformis.AAC.1
MPETELLHLVFVVVTYDVVPDSRKCQTQPSRTRLIQLGINPHKHKVEHNEELVEHVSSRVEVDTLKQEMLVSYICVWQER